jgi:hypothetical protein
MERLRMVDWWTGYVRLTSRRDVAPMSQMRKYRFGRRSTERLARSTYNQRFNGFCAKPHDARRALHVRSPEDRRDPGRRRGRLQPARGRGRGSHACAAAGIAQRSDRASYGRCLMASVRAASKLRIAALRLDKARRLYRSSAVNSESSKMIASFSSPSKGFMESMSPTSSTSIGRVQRR